MTHAEITLDASITDYCTRLLHLQQKNSQTGKKNQEKYENQNKEHEKYGDSMVKQLYGWEMSKKFQDCNIYIYIHIYIYIYIYICVCECVCVCVCVCVCACV